MNYIENYPLHPLIFEIIKQFDYCTYIKIIKQLLLCHDWEYRQGAFYLLCKVNASVYNISKENNELDHKLVDEINRILFLKTNNYDSFVDELMEDKPIDNARLEYLLSKYKPNLR